MPDSQYPFLGPPDRPGDLGTLGDYRIVRLLGEGGMGYVFRGEDDRLGRAVAVKVMKPAIAAKPQAKQRFFREGRAAAAVKSDFVVIIHQVGEAGGVPYLVMEHLEGRPLDAWLRDRGDKAPAPVVVRVARDALAGLVAAHARGLVHRDIKPSNLWAEAPSGRFKLLDFGLTRSVDGADQLTDSGALVGTPAYMAPEQVNNADVDGRADLFSLGVVMYRMLTGASPFDQGSTFSTIYAVLNTHPPPLLGVPSQLAVFVMRLLCKSPAGRPATAATALSELDALATRLKLDAADAVVSSWASSSRIAAVPEPAPRPSPTRQTPPPEAVTATMPGRAARPRPAPSSGAVAEPAWRAYTRRRSVLAAVGLLIVLFGAGLGLLLGGGTRAGGDSGPEGTVGGPDVPIVATVGERPPPLSGHNAPDEVRASQAAWAAYLNVPVTEVVDLGDEKTLELVLIPPGTFWMGSPDSEAGRDRNELQHEVTLSRPFYLGKFEVTQDQFEAVMGFNPSYHQAGRHRAYEGKDTTRYPVDGIELDEAEKFAAAVSRKVGRGREYRLPTEAEWEYAAREGIYSKVKSVMYGQRDYPLYLGLLNPVDTFAPNSFGLMRCTGMLRKYATTASATFAQRRSPIRSGRRHVRTEFSKAVRGTRRPRQAARRPGAVITATHGRGAWASGWPGRCRSTNQPAHHPPCV